MKEKTKKEVLIDGELDSIMPGTSVEHTIDVDAAWNKVCSRTEALVPVIEMKPAREVRPYARFIRIAAAVLILAGLGSAAIYTFNRDAFSRTITASTDGDHKNVTVSLSDGSIITLNRNSTLTYRTSFGKRNRNVTLEGEAFFEIAPDAANPFIIDAGKASVRVVGTSFNVITGNSDAAVEVFVTSGTVMLSDNSGGRSIMVEPGYIGTMDPEHSGKTLNTNPNYMAWNTGRLEYDNQLLETVFSDLKRVYNMDIVAEDPSILSSPWTSAIVSQSSDTIISIICASFNLGYSKDGNVYRLSKK
ncbi:MAG: FecR domain-containing protein [Bacteroidales bacterium]|jgi:ferric-dicitrate binding protein FerR (iron transport regulator)|nr:FecR domain-containing protein [Bacteroidales bacterium]